MSLLLQKRNKSILSERVGFVRLIKKRLSLQQPQIWAVKQGEFSYWFVLKLKRFAPLLSGVFWVPNQ